MALEYVWKGLLVIAAVSIIGVVLVQAGFVSAPWGVDDGEVRIFDDGSGDESTVEADRDDGDEADGNSSAGETDDDTNGTDDDTGTEPKAVVDVEVADTGGERYTGLSNHDSLERGNGMLFVHDKEQELTYVMRDMDFDIDIIFIDADREITEIHHARAPGPNEDGEDIQYSGRGKWVLEVPRGYANETGIEVGDRVEIDLESNQTAIFDADASEPFERPASVSDRDEAVPAAVAA